MATIADKYKDEKFDPRRVYGDEGLQRQEGVTSGTSFGGGRNIDFSLLPEYLRNSKLYKLITGYPGAVEQEFTSGVQGLDEAIRSGGNTLLPSMQMRAAPVIPLIRGAAELAAGPLAASINREAEERNRSLDQLASQLGYDPETFPFVDTVRERGGVTEAQVAKPLTFLLGALRGQTWKSALKGSIQKGPTTQQSKQWIALIKKDKGAWAEAKKTGLDKFLEANPKPSQAELISFLDQGGIELTETVKADNADFPDKERLQGRLAEVNDRKNATLDQILDYPNKARNRIVAELEAAGLSRYEAEYASQIIGKPMGEVTDEEVNEYVPILPKLKAVFIDEELNDLSIRLHDIRRMENADDSEIIFYMRSSVTREASELVRSFDNDKNLVEFLEEELIRGAGNPTKYGRDTNLNLPGGENPTEILIQLPTDAWNDQYETRLAEIAETHGRSANPWGYANYATPEEQQELRALINKREVDVNQTFTGGHWDEPNVLVHARLNDRTVGGVYSKHAEEYQSDWAQQAEKKRRDEIKRLARDKGISREAAAKQVSKDFGYQQPPLSVDEIELEVVPREQALRESGNAANASFMEKHLTEFRTKFDIPQDAPLVQYRFKGDDAWSYNFDPIFSKEDAVERYNNYYIRGSTDRGALSDALIQRLEQVGTGLPDQPYKDDPFELAWRRHFLETLRDPNTTRMTWTTGDVQKDRYNLGKYIDSIDVQLQDEATDDYPSSYNLGVQYKDGHTESPDDINEFDLEDHVGKELADKIVKDFSSDFEPRTYSGLDLEMGGKFHDFIYDKKVPQYAKEFLKNYRDANGNKIVPKRIHSENIEHLEMIHRATIAELTELTKRANQLQRDYPGIQEKDHWMNKQFGVIELNFETLDAKLSRIEERLDKKGDLWYIDTTPEMEEDFIEGMPLTMDTTKEQPAFA